VVLAAGASVGEITSATHSPDHGVTVMLARVRWTAAAAALLLEDGTPLSVVG
jgi:glycine cleavage system aminomethyltransferase T